MKSSGAKIAWDKIRLDKKERGLAIKSLEDGTKLPCPNMSGFLLSETSLWCEWMKAFMLKGYSFGEVKIPHNAKKDLEKIAIVERANATIHQIHHG